MKTKMDKIIQITATTNGRYTLLFGLCENGDVYYSANGGKEGWTKVLSNFENKEKE